LNDFQRTVYPHSGHPLAEGRAQERVSLPAKDWRPANCATQGWSLCLRGGDTGVDSLKNVYQSLLMD